ncbi:MAG: hypothetical protein O7F73_21455 [Gammaproteobacteria bacterium]|nr:hypothetical protein [Gammaproteobacteria bacterium]
MSQQLQLQNILQRGMQALSRGDIPQASQCCQKALKLKPDLVQAHWALSGSNRATDRQHIEEMDALAGRQGQHPRAQAFYWYAMGKELEDLQDWDAAFDAFSRGAGARRSTIASHISQPVPTSAAATAPTSAPIVIFVSRSPSTKYSLLSIT